MGIDNKTTNNGSQTDGQLKENESNTRAEGLSGFGKDYGSREARLALALADAGGGTNGGNIATDVGEIEALIGTSSDDAEDSTVLGKLTAIEEKLTEAEVESTYSDNVYSITNTPAEAMAANANAIEITLQNTGEEIIRLRLGSNPTDTIHWVLPVNAILVFSGLKARQSIHASVESTDNTGQLYITTTDKAAAT